MTQSEQLVLDALREHPELWWAPNDPRQLRFAGLAHLIEKSTPSSAVECLIASSRFGDAEDLLSRDLRPELRPAETERLRRLLEERRRAGLVSVRSQLRRLRLRAERASHRWDPDLAVLAEDAAEEAADSALEVITQLIEQPLAEREASLSESLLKKAESAPNYQEIVHCVSRRLWSRAKHLIEHPGHDAPGRQPMPPLATLTVSPTWVQRLVAERTTPHDCRTAWRELDDVTVDLVARIRASEEDGAMAFMSMLDLVVEQIGTKLQLSGFGPALDTDTGSSAFDGLEIQLPELATEKLLRAVLSRGDRRLQLLRVALHGAAICDVFDRISADVSDIEQAVALTLELTAATADGEVAAAICLESGHHPRLVRVLLGSLHPHADVDRVLTIADVDRARHQPAFVSTLAASLDDIEREHPLAYRALRAAVAYGVTEADVDTLQLLVDDEVDPEVVRTALLVSGLARDYGNAEVVLAVEPLQLVEVLAIDARLDD